MSAPRSISVKERLKAAKLAERSVQVCLRGDLAAEHDLLERQLAALPADAGPTPGDQRRSSQRMGQKPPRIALAERLLQLRQEMADAMLDLRVRALPRAVWQSHVREHPPSPDDEKDVAMGVDFDALLAVVTPLCIVDPVLDEEDWAQLNDVLSSGDYDRVLGAVWEVNRSGVDLPKSRLASLVMAESGDDSK